MPTHQEQATAMLDGLAYIRAITSCDQEAADGLLATFDQGSDDWKLFLSAVGAHAALAYISLASHAEIPLGEFFDRQAAYYASR